MKEISRYKYEKRIKELETEVLLLKDYRRVMNNVFYAIANVVSDGNSVSQGWILHQFKELLK